MEGDQLDRPRLFGGYRRDADEVEEGADPAVQGRPNRPRPRRALLSSGGALRSTPVIADTIPSMAAVVIEQAVAQGDAGPASFAAVVRALLGRETSDPLHDLAAEADRIVGSHFVAAISRERYQEVLDNLKVELVRSDEPVLGLLHNAIIDQQQRRWPELIAGFESALAEGDLDAAEAALGRAAAAKRDAQRLALCDADLASAKRRREEEARFRQRLERARALVIPDAFLETLRDARAIFDALLDEAPHFCAAEEIDEFRRERGLLDDRIHTEEQAQDQLSTPGALDELGPNLRALRAYEDRRARGERSVRFDGPDLVPVEQVIATLTARIRPKVHAVVLKHLADAERLLDQHGNVEAALKRLRQRRELWPLLEHQVWDQFEERHAELTERVDQRARESRLAERVRCLLDEGRFEQALNELDLAVATQGPNAHLLDGLRDAVLRRWLAPYRKRYELLDSRLGEAHPSVDRLRTLRAAVESLEDDLAQVSGTPPGIGGLRDAVHGLSQRANLSVRRLQDFGAGVARAEKLATEGRLDEVRALFDDLEARVPGRKDELVGHRRDLQFRVQRDSALASATRLVASEPARALALCEAYSDHDEAFRRVSLMAERRRALSRIDQFELVQDYDAIIAEAQGLVDRLDGPERTEFNALVTHYTHVRDYKAQVENQLPKARDALAAKRYSEALNLLDGLTFSRRAQVQANHISRQALVALSAQYRAEIESVLVGGARKGVTLESVRVGVEFLRRHEDAAPENRFIVARFDFIEAMGVARAHLDAGNVEEAIATAQGLVGLGSEANVARFVNECRIAQFVAGFNSAISMLELDQAESLVGESELVAAPEVIEARKLVADVRGVFRILETGDVPEAWRQAYALVKARHDDRPPAHLMEFLERLRQQRIADVKSACEVLRAQAYSGYTFDQIELIVRDVEARAPWETGEELDGLVETIRSEQNADFEAVVSLARQLVKAKRMDGVVLERTIRRLTLATKHQEDEGDRAIAQELLRPLRRRQADVRRVSHEAVEATNLVDRAFRDQDFTKLERAYRLLVALGTDPHDIKSLMEGWRSADRIALQVEREIAAGRFDKAEEGLDALERLRAQAPIPHSDSLTIVDTRHGRIGPGIASVRVQLDALRRQAASERARLQASFTAVNRQLEGYEARRDELLRQVQIDEPARGIDDARVRAEALAEDIAMTEAFISGLDEQALTGALLEQTRALSSRLRRLDARDLTSAVTRERRALENDFSILQSLFRLSPDSLSSQYAQVRRVAKRWQGSGRIRVWCQAIRHKIGDPPRDEDDESE